VALAQPSTPNLLRRCLLLQVVMFEDLVQRRQALDVLMSYNPFWLHIAVEVVTQKAFKPEGEAQPAAAEA
jgi:hypothetical protein